MTGELLHPVVSNVYRPGEGLCFDCRRRSSYTTLIDDVPVALACPRHNLAVLAMAMRRSTRVVSTYPPYKEHRQ